jgi:type IV secretion system protein VirB4
MLPVKEFTEGPAGFPSLIGYFEFVAEGVLFNRDGSLLGCFYYCGPDMDSSEGLQEDQLSCQVQSIFQNFGNGWSVHVDLIRVGAIDYPQTHHFNNPTSLLIEKHRRERYEREGDHFENIYTISFCYLPSVIEKKYINNFFVQNTQKDKGPGLEFNIEIFNQKLDEFQGNMANKIHIRRMSSSQMMTFLNRCIYGGKAEIPVPQPPCYLNHYLGAHEFVAGHEPMIDDRYIGVITLTQFPYESYCGILNVLSTLPFEYRFSSRFLFYDPIDALGIIEEYQGKYLGMKYSIGQMIMGAFGKDPRLNPDAANRAVMTKIEETKMAQQALELGQVNYGYATLVVVILDGEKGECKRKTEYVRDLLNNNWFPSIIEKMNAPEAFLGSLPGETLKNVRKPFINTQNLADMLPLTDVWTGALYNPCPLYPQNSPPLFYAATRGTTPFRFNVHVGDVGHTLILGPTGSGKSVLLSHMANSALRYEGAQVYFFDKGHSQYVLTHAVGGDFYDIMGENEEVLSFSPLGHLEGLSEQRWACGWIERIIALQGVAVDPTIRAAIEAAVRDTSQSSSKTMSDFFLNLQNNEIKEALKPFVQIKEGYMSGLLDAKEDGFKKGRFQTFEISNLMGLDNRLSTPVLLYLFHKIQSSLDGRPTFIMIDEGWLIMLHETFMTYWIEFLRTVRKNNACVILATQSLSDIVHSPYVNFINENCLTKIFLPNPAAREADNKILYQSLGLNDRQIEIISDAVRKKHYYVTARGVGCRLIDLGLESLELAFYGVGTSPQERQIVKELEKSYGDSWPAKWLESKGLVSEAKEWLAYHRVADGSEASPPRAGFCEQLRVSGMRTEHGGEIRGQDPMIRERT